MDRYLNRLLVRKKSDKKAEFDLTLEQIMGIYHKQGGKCALTGRDLQCQVVPGVTNMENASIDRIKAGGAYTADNIQLVCLDVNTFRGGTPIKNFIHVCCLVAKHVNEKPS